MYSGATVIKVVTKKRPRRALFDEETNNGKLTMELDLEAEADKAGFSSSSSQLHESAVGKRSCRSRFQ